MGSRKATIIVAYTINRVRSPTTLNKSFYELLFGTPRNYPLKVFGFVYFILLQPHERTKLKPCFCLCYFLGYGIEHKCYRYYDPIDNHLCILHHVTF
jgi:hypothetical protein